MLKNVESFTSILRFCDRTSCTNKSDDELPRYGKKWAFTPNIPATQSRLLKQLNQDRHKTDKVNEANKDDEPPEITETSTEEQVSTQTLPEKTMKILR